MLSQRVLVIGITLLSAVTLGRLLPPAEFGIAAMATVAFSCMTILRSFGLSAVAIQRAEISPDEINFLFWINVFTSAALAGLLAAASPWIADYFNEPKVRDLTLAMCVPLLVGGCSSQFHAMLQRNLQFDKVMRSESLGLVLGFVVGLGVAFWRHDAWAIVAAGTVHALTTAIYNFLSCSWRPGRPKRIAGGRRLFMFGLDLTAYSLTTSLSSNLGSILIGRTLGATPLGFYNRAYQLFLIPGNTVITPVMSVMMPVLSRLQNDGPAFRQAYLALIERLCLLLIPLSIGLYFAAPSLMPILLGPNWAPAGLILALLAPALAAQGMTAVVQPLLTAQGRSAELRNWGFGEATLRLIGIVAGLQYGAAGAAAGLSLASLLTVPLAAWLIGRKGMISLADQARAGLCALPMAFGVLAGCLLALYVLGHLGTKSAGPSLLLIVALGGSIGVITGLVEPHSRRVLVDLLRELPWRFRRRKAVRPSATGPMLP